MVGWLVGWLVGRLGGWVRCTRATTPTTVPNEVLLAPRVTLPEGARGNRAGGGTPVQRNAPACWEEACHTPA